MALIRAKAKDAFDYVVNVVFQVPKEGPLYKALEKSGDTDIRDMVTLRACDIDSLTYDRNDTDKNIPLTKKKKKLLRIFQDYILHCHSIGNPTGGLVEWLGGYRYGQVLRFESSTKYVLARLGLHGGSTEPVPYILACCQVHRCHGGVSQGTWM